MIILLDMDQVLINIGEETVNQDIILVERINRYFTCFIFSVIMCLLFAGFIMFIYGMSINIQ